MSDLVFVSYRFEAPDPANTGRTISGFGDTVLDRNSLVLGEIDVNAVRLEIESDLQNNHGTPNASVTVGHFENLVPSSSTADTAYFVWVHWSVANGASDFADFAVKHNRPIQIGQDIEAIRQFIMSNKLIQPNQAGAHVTIIDFERLPADD